MNIDLDIYNNEGYKLPALSDEEVRERLPEQKGWSLSYVYHLRELRDIYLVIEKYNPNNIQETTEYVIKFIEPEKTQWKKRRVLENVNALRNFELIGESFQIIEQVFKESKINEPLSENDLKIFKAIYFNYFRFKEMIAWFLKPLSSQDDIDYSIIDEELMKKKSVPLFFFSNRTRFFDSFLYDLKPDSKLYFIDNDMEHLVRFWDVFIKWGMSLELVERFNLSSLDINIAGNKSISCAYFKSGKDLNIDLIDYLKDNFNTEYIFIPEIVFKLAVDTRVSVKQIKEFVIREAVKKRNEVAIERTSEIFIIKGNKEFKNQERASYLYPKYNDSYISHLILR